MLFILAEFLVLKHLQLFREDSTMGKGNLINILPFWVQFSKVTRLMPFFLSVCQSSYSSTLGQHKPHSSGEEKSGGGWVASPQTLQHPWLTSRSPEGKTTKWVQHKSVQPAGLGCLSLCVPARSSNRDLGGTQPAQPQPRTVPAARTHTGKDARRTTRNIRDYQVKQLWSQGRHLGRNIFHQFSSS